VIRVIRVIRVNVGVSIPVVIRVIGVITVNEGGSLTRFD
jgi:hypothetical protein